MPTIDPTYGRPIPIQAPAPKLAPDASWIWTKGVSNNQTIYLRKSFRIPASPRKAILYVTADNAFAAFVNGQGAGATPVDPNDGNLWQRVQTVDVSSLLKPGLNVVAVQAHNDSDAAGMLARLEIDGKPVVLSDKSWRASEETPSSEWTGSSFDDSAWPYANEENRVGTGPWGGNLDPWPTPLNVVPPYLFHLPVKPVRWAYPGDPDQLIWHDATQRMNVDRPKGAQADWRIIVDFGQELTGRVITEGSIPPVITGTGESTGEALAKPWTTTASNATPYSALRYATFTLPARIQRANLNVRLDLLYYPVQYRGSFDCSDPLLTKVWYTGAYTAHLCMQQDIWDAPKRDRQRWMGDLHVSGEVINNVFADRFLMERTMLSLRTDAQGGRADSELPGGHINGIPGYSYSWIAGLADFYRHVGDKEYLENQHQALLSMLEFCRQDLDENGLFANKHGAWVYTDWSPGFGNDSPESRGATHMFFCKAVKEAVFLLHELGDDSNASKYQQLANQLEKAAQDHLVSDRGTFGDRKQENAMAIFSGVASRDQANKIFEAKIFKPEVDGSEPVVSPYYGNYVLRAMGIAGRTQDGLDYVRSFWGQMVKDGATTFYETYDPFWNKNNFHAHLQWDEHNNDAAGYHVSLCHGWSAGPTTFLTECVLGVQPTGAGFRTCSITPSLGDLTWASGVVPTPHGDIRLRVDRQSSGLTLKLTIPKGVTAQLTLPNSISTFDGKQVTGKLLQVGAGAHTITGA